MSLRKAAVAAIAASPLTVGRQKITKDVVIAASAEKPLILNGIDAKTINDDVKGDYRIVYMTFEGMDGSFFSTSTRQANAMYDAFMEDVGGDVDALNAAVVSEKIALRFTLQPTRKGNPMLAISIE